MVGLKHVQHRYRILVVLTQEEVREENREAEGDAQLKSRIRALQRDMARKRMMAQIPKANVVVTNPTHFAVAMKYEPGQMGAPMVVAKGADQVAFNIRKVAEAHEVPLVENPPLARALYASVEIDQEIPPEHYRAVAEVISYVFKLKGRALGP